MRERDTERELQREKEKERGRREEGGSPGFTSMQGSATTE